MDSRHILQKFPEIRCPLDHHSKPPAQAVEQWTSDVHTEVGHLCSQFSNPCGSHIVELSAPQKSVVCAALVCASVFCHVVLL